MASKTAIIAIAVVAVVVIAGAAVFLLKGNGSSNHEYDNIDSKLMVRGNANGDYTIDKEDLGLIEDIIAGKIVGDYPMADANYDGFVNDKDVALVKDIIDRKNGITVYVVCNDVNGKDTTVEVKYPLRNVVTYATNMQMPCLFANGGDYVAGYFSKSYDVAESALADAVDLGGTARQISDAAWANFTALDASLADKGGVGALLVDHSGIAQITEQRKADLDEAGIPMIDYSSADATEELTTVLTLGFLFGGDSENLGLEYAKLGWNVVEKIDSTLKKADIAKKSYICGTMFIYICGAKSSFNTSATTAGGIAYATLNEEFNKKYSGNSTKMDSTEALSNYTDAQIFINNRSMDWGLDEDEYDATIIDTWDHDNKGVSSREYFKDFEDKLVYVNNLLPGGVKLAYMAHAMYGELFDRDWADGVLKDYLKLGSEPFDDITFDEILAYITFDDYKRVAD
jgi:hypothetical protein